MFKSYIFWWIFIRICVLSWRSKYHRHSFYFLVRFVINTVENRLTMRKSILDRIRMLLFMWKKWLFWHKGRIVSGWTAWLCSWWTFKRHIVASNRSIIFIENGLKCWHGFLFDIIRDGRGLFMPFYFIFAIFFLTFLYFKQLYYFP